MKVVILTPGSTGFSLVPDDRINHNSLIPSLSTLPTIPLILILLHNWETHRSSPWPEEQWKEFGDIQNLNQLVDIAVEKGEHLANDKSWIPGKALEAGKKRFRDFAKQSGVTNIASWNAIGFSRYQFY